MKLKSFLIAVMTVAAVVTVAAQDFVSQLNMSRTSGMTGDLNEDGKLDNKDTKLLEQYILNKKPAGITKAKADVNGDGVVNVADIVRLVIMANSPIGLSAATSEHIGCVVCAEGHLHAAKTAVPSGCTAVGVLGKVCSTGHGLILALQNAKSQDWETVMGWPLETGYAGTTLKILPDDAARGSLTSYTKLGSTEVSNWALAQKSDYEAIFKNLGAAFHYNGYTYDDNVNAFFTTGVGGTALSKLYLSATTHNSSYDFWFFGEIWFNSDFSPSINVRPILAF
jgi:hypothetical protein